MNDEAEKCGPLLPNGAFHPASPRHFFGSLVVKLLFFSRSIVYLLFKRHVIKYAAVNYQRHADFGRLDRFSMHILTVCRYTQAAAFRREIVKNPNRESFPIGLYCWDFPRFLFCGLLRHCVQWLLIVCSTDSIYHQTGCMNRKRHAINFSCEYARS